MNFYWRLFWEKLFYFWYVSVVNLFVVKFYFVLFIIEVYFVYKNCIVLLLRIIYSLNCIVYLLSFYINW